MGCFLLPRINLGNIIRKFEYAYTTTATDNLSNGTVIAYAYPSAGWKDQLASYNNESIVYDELGNPVNYRGNILSWSHGRQLDKFNDIAYKYNADGIRTSKTVSGVTTQFYLDGTKLLAQSDGNLLLFHYGNEGVIGFTYQGVGTYYYIKNILGDIVGIIDNNGQIIAKYAYDAWGNHNTYVLNDNTFVDISVQSSYTQSGLNNKLIATINPFRYRSYYYDSETGLYYLNSRYYDPETGRFINADAIEYLDKDTFNGLNLYSYCTNNPIMHTDITGKWFILDDIISAVVGFVTGVVGQFVSDVVTSIFSGTINFSTWETYLGSGIGGAIGGWSCLYVGPVLGVVIGSGTSTLISQGLESLTGTNIRSFGEIISNTLVSIGLSLITVSFASSLHIPGITSGSHSFSQVWKSGISKSIKYGYKMSLKTVVKGFVSELIKGFTSGWIIESIVNSVFELKGYELIKLKGNLKLYLV